MIVSWGFGKGFRGRNNSQKADKLNHRIFLWYILIFLKLSTDLLINVYSLFKFINFYSLVRDNTHISIW
jgi:hypothetical protein